MMFEDWWRRSDVRHVLTSHYLSIGDASRFIIVGRRKGWLVVADRDINGLLDSISPLYLGFSVSGWNGATEVLDAGPTRSAIEFDLDNFPDAIKDLLTLKDWFDSRRVQVAVYFTGSKGVRILAGSTRESYKTVAYWTSVLCSLQGVSSLDMFPYSMLEGWLQPAATIHRKSGLPAFPINDIPTSHEALFERAAAVLRGDPIPELETKCLDGEAFIRAVKNDYDALDKEDQKRVDRGAKALMRQALRGTYEYR